MRHDDSRVVACARPPAAWKLGGRRLTPLALAACLAGGAALLLPAPAHAIDARILLGLERSGGLERALERVSDPRSSDYRDHRSISAARQRYGASPATVRRVRGFLAARGVESSLDPTGTFVAATLSEDQAAEVFGSGIVRLIEAEGIAANAPGALPRGLRGAVLEVAGLQGFAEGADAAAIPRRREGNKRTNFGSLDLPARSGRAEGCPRGREVTLPGELGRAFPGTKPFTPNQIQTAFGFDPLHRAGIQGQGQSIALVEFGGNVRSTDVAEYASCFGLPQPTVRTHAVGIPRVIAPIDGGDTTLETTLDVQTLIAAAPRARIELMQGDGATPWAEVLAASLDKKRLGRLPGAVSISYGVCELLASQSGAGPADRRLFERVARVAGLAGVSVVVSSGDSGSSGCAHLFGSSPLDEVPITVLAGTASVSWPASSPAVTAVGGTAMRLDARNRIVSQRPWNDTEDGVPAAQIETTPQGKLATYPAGAGTGGASKFYSRPGYQADAGLALGRRQVPDISMYAASAPGVVIRCSAFDTARGVGPCPPRPDTGSWSSVGGTSFAAPLLAGGIVLANQLAAKRGEPSLGFANPLLYERSTRRSAIRDVTRGTNAIFDVGCCRADRGYDQATGWGTVDVARLARAASRAWQKRG